MTSKICYDNFENVHKKHLAKQKKFLRSLQELGVMYQ